VKNLYVEHNSGSKAMVGINNIAPDPSPLENIVVLKLENGSIQDVNLLQEEEITLIAIAVRIYRDIIKRRNGDKFNHNGNGSHISSWLSKWIHEIVVNDNRHELLLKRYNNGFNYRFFHTIVNDFYPLD
jgi:hypothetical protein